MLGPRSLPLAASLFGLVLLAVGCATSGDPAPMLTDHMDDHFVRVGEVQTALVYGDVAGARDPALWLAEHAEHAALPTGLPAAAEVRDAARAIARAADLAEAVRIAAELGTACGGCHVAAGRRLTFRSRSMPPAGPVTGPHMLRHLWAADRLWEGLIGPSGEQWELGTRALAEDPLFLGGDEAVASEAGALAGEVHALGVEGRRATSAAERADVYARLLGTCARCHGLVGVTR